MKRFISLLLVFVLTLGITTPAAFAAEEERLPIVYIRGNGEPLYDADGNELTADSGDGSVEMEEIVESVVNILKPFVTEGMLFDKWDNYGKAVYEEIAPLFADTGLDENGNAKNGTGVSPEQLAKSEMDAQGSWHYDMHIEYEFCFDWRLSPYDHVDRLHQYVLDVMKATGKTQVSMYGRCLGGGLLMAYLEKYGHLGHIKNVLFVDVLSNGSDIISKTFSGKLEFDADYLENYVGQLDYCEKTNKGIGFAFPELLNEIVFQTMDYFNQINAVDALLCGLERLYSRLYKALIPALLHAMGYATQVNYWTCVYEEDMDEALDLIFGTEGTETRTKYKGLIDKILYYRERVSSDLPGFYDQLTENGIWFGFTAKYGYLAMLPIVKNERTPGDSLVNIESAAFGATAADMGTQLSEEYINARIAEGNGKYISPDKMVDLSTSYCPDRTWVLKNAHHDEFQPVFPIIYEFLDGTRETVDTVSAGTQFMIFNPETREVAEMTESNCADLAFMSTAEKNPTFVTMIKSYFSLCIMFFRFLVKLITGEVDFGSLFG
ncbi:MAG: hypothetical protein IJA31_07575 [Clostridia bacterium]|nr:hypothetical protein [Clostridia bacterium]MBQ4631579.1 hypothetical protein [Clostridia bacterium]